MADKVQDEWDVARKVERVAHRLHQILLDLRQIDPPNFAVGVAKRLPGDQLRLLREEIQRWEAL